MRKNFTGLNRNFLASVLIPLGCIAQAGASSTNGWVTPSSLTYHFTSLSVNNDSGSAASLIANPFDLTFSRTDQDFASVSVSSIILPYGRYLSVGLCSTGTVDVTLDGVKFDGYGGVGGIAFGSAVYSVNATNSAGAVSTTGSAVALHFEQYGGGASCVLTFLASPLCVSDTAQSICQAGDVVYTGTGAATNTKGNGLNTGAVNASFKVSLMVDLYDSVTIDGSSGQGVVLSVPPVMALIGDPGAAVHITKKGSASEVPFNASLLFGSDKTLLSSYITQSGGAAGGSPLTHSCQGSNNVGIVGGSSNFPYRWLGMVSVTANSNLGQVLVPMVSSCQTPSTCNSSGAEQIDNVFQAVGSSASLHCIDDSSSTMQTANFGYNYTGGSGASSGIDTADIVRIVDPGNIFGACSSSPCVDTATAPNGGYF